MNLAPQSLLVVGRPTSTAPTPENIFDRLLSLLRESGGASVAYNQVATKHTKMDYHIINAYTNRFWISWQRTSIKNGIRCTTVLKWRTVWQRWGRWAITHLIVFIILGVQASSRKDHPAWFADLSTNARTKEEFMNKNCQVSDLYHIDDHNDGFPVCFISYWSQKISHQITYRPELGATWQRQNLSWKRKLSVKIRSSWYRTWLVTRDLTELTNSSFRFKTSKAD